MSILPSGSGALVFIAFEGQDADASEAASSLVKDLIEVWDLSDSEILDTDGFYEFRFSEPEIIRDEEELPRSPGRVSRCIGAASANGRSRSSKATNLV